MLHMGTIPPLCCGQSVCLKTCQPVDVHHGNFLAEAGYLKFGQQLMVLRVHREGNCVLRIMTT
jgi:hypothetical protein